MEIREVMTSDVRLVDPGTTLKDAALMMREGNFGLLPIGENDRLVGTITDRDIAIRAVASGKDPNRATVRDAMSDGHLLLLRRPVGRRGRGDDGREAGAAAAGARSQQAHGRDRRAGRSRDQSAARTTTPARRCRESRSIELASGPAVAVRHGWPGAARRRPGQIERAGVGWPGIRCSATSVTRDGDLRHEPCGGCSDDRSAAADRRLPVCHHPTPAALTPAPAAATLAPARSPELQPGATFVFRQRDGEEVTSRVVAVDGSDETWQSDNGWTWTGKEFFWPIESWQSEGGGGSQEISGDPDALFPLMVGEQVAYRYQGQSQSVQAGFSGQGRCEVAAAEQITVPAGTFDTYKVVCVQGEDLSAPYRTRTWWYAPAVGHYVAMLHQTTDRRVDQLEQLVSYRAG